MLLTADAGRLVADYLGPGALALVVLAGLGALAQLGATQLLAMRATLLTPRGPHRHLRWSPSGEVGVVEMDVPPGVYMARVFFAHHYVASQALTVPDPAVPGRASDSKEATEIVLRTTPASSLSSDGPSPRPSTEPGRGGSAE